MRAEGLPRVWEEPVRGAYPDPRIFLGLRGADQIRTFLQGLAPAPPIAHLTGMHPTEVGPNTSVFEMPATEWLTNPAGRIPLGALAILADGPLGCAVQTALPAATPYTTAEISLTALRPAESDGSTLVARGRLIHAGRSLGLSEVAIADANGDLVAHGTSRCFIFPPKAPPPETAPQLEPVAEPSHEHPDPYLRPVAGEIVPQEIWDARSGLEVMHALLSGELLPPPITVLTGLRPTEAAEGRCTFVLPATEWLNSPTGLMEGGAIAMLAEMALIAAVQTTVEPGTSFAPFDLKVNFLRPVTPDGRNLIARGSVVHRGKSLAVASSEITNAEGKSVAVAIGTSMILPGRPWHRPAIPAEEAPPPG
jgi:uncharacterized protein (TIGR00369 family)